MRPESECGSMKVLLKQVYGIHTSRIKCLEDEIEELKKKLTEAETSVKNCESECKRCIELEEAFSSCKAALLEQSKMFDNLGQKFLNFNPTENKTSGDKTAECPQENPECLVNNNTTPVATVKKVGLSSNTKIHFLKNLMSLNVEDNQESLDFSVPLRRNMNPEYSTLNPDSMVLVPNTLDFTCDFEEKKKAPSHKEVCKRIDNGITKELDINVTENVENTDHKVKKKKRSSDESELNNVKLNKENETKLSVNKKLKTSMKPTEDNSKISSAQTNDFTSPKYKNFKNEVDVSNGDKDNKSKTLTLDITIQKVKEEDMDDSKKNIDKKSVGCASAKDDSFMTAVSPSLLPLGEKTNTKAIHNPLINAEDNDFQDPSTCKKIQNEGGTWTSCDKKKLSKKIPNLRPIKSSSKFKLQLDSLPPNYKKPNYRQTKLSKSIFQPKSASCVKQEEDSEVECIDDKEEDSGKEFENVLPATAASSKTVDFDATCIPENYEYEVIPSGNTSTKDKTNRSEAFVNDDSDYSDCDSSSEMIVLQNPATSKQDKAKENSLSKHMDPGQLGNSFDRLPKRAEPNYKYKEETVRKKSERKQLTAFDCKECEKYYSELGLSDEEKKHRMQKCSRHRSKFAPPPTPKHFWELEFPDTQECKARGYLNETQKVQLKTHRKRPL